VVRLQIAKRVGSTSRRQQIRAFSIVTAIAAVPALATIAIQILTAQPDLSNLISRLPEEPLTPMLLDWPTLLRTGAARDSKRGEPEVPMGALVRILGYMIDIDAPVRDDTPVSEFGLITEAGTLLHPPHRIPEEMVDVRLKPGAEIGFEQRRLVWAEGILERNVSFGRKGQPAYVLWKAVAKRAERSDIPRYFAAR
jgi:hypothetical protein